MKEPGRHAADWCGEEPEVEGVAFCSENDTHLFQTPGGWVWVEVSLWVWKQEVEGVV